MLDAPTINLHGAAVVIDNIGVLIRGNSGSGKTELAMELISRGHKFVADDLVVVQQIGSDKCLSMQAKPESIGFAHIRGVGFIDVGKCFAASTAVIRHAQRLDLVIDLTANELNHDNSIFTHNYTEILGVMLPNVYLVTTKHKNLALISEIIVRSFIQRRNGYDANSIFVKRFSS